MLSSFRRHAATHAPANAVASSGRAADNGGGVAQDGAKPRPGAGPARRGGRVAQVGAVAGAAAYVRCGRAGAALRKLAQNAGAVAAPAGAAANRPRRGAEAGALPKLAQAPHIPSERDERPRPRRPRWRKTAVGPGRRDAQRRRPGGRCPRWRKTGAGRPGRPGQGKRALRKLAQIGERKRLALIFKVMRKKGPASALLRG